MHIHVYPLAKNNQSNVQVQSSDVEVVVVAIVKVQVPAVIPTPTKDMLLLAVDSWLLTEKVGVSEWLTCSHVITFLVQPYSDFAVSLPRRNLYFGSVSDYKFTCVCMCVCVCVLNSTGEYSHEWQWSGIHLSTSHGFANGRILWLLIVSCWP